MQIEDRHQRKLYNIVRRNGKMSKGDAALAIELLLNYVIPYDVYIDIEGGEFGTLAPLHTTLNRIMGEEGVELP